MALRPDSIYRVDLGSNRESSTQPINGAEHPPKIIQIRLTEHTLQELVVAHAKPGQSSTISVDVGRSDPMLKIGDMIFPLQAPLTSSGSSTAGPTPTELFRLSEDESTLIRLGAVANKLSVKPTGDLSAAAQRLKHLREEEELRKEERKRAVMVGSNTVFGTKGGTPTHSRSNSTNKNLKSARAIDTSALPRSASLNKLSARKNFRAEGSPFGREQSPSLQGQSVHQNSALSQRTPFTPSDVTHLSKVENRTFSVSRPRDSVNSRLQEDLLSDSEDGEDKDALSENAPSASQHVPNATKKSISSISKRLTTRQRLAKASKGGTRLLSDTEQRSPAVAGGSNFAGSSIKGGDCTAKSSVMDSTTPGHRRAASAISVKDFEKQSVSRSDSVKRAVSPIRTPARFDHLRWTSLDKPVALTPPYQSPELPLTGDRSKEVPAGAEKTGRSVADGFSKSNPDLKRSTISGSNIHAVKPNPSASIPRKEAQSSTESPAMSERKRKRSNDIGSESLRATEDSRAASSNDGHLLQMEQLSASTRRTVKGVGPGAAHWSEPWLDVRSKADWHKLAERFAKTQEDYSASRHRLEEEHERLNAEMQLALLATNEQASKASVPLHEADKQNWVDATDDKMPRSRKTISDDESAEEGEMLSSDESGTRTGQSAHKFPRKNQDYPTLIEDESVDEDLSWRLAIASDDSNRGSAMSRSQVRQPGPLSYKALSESVAGLHELHGSLSRMHHVLLAFKQRDRTA